MHNVIETKKTPFYCCRFYLLVVLFTSAKERTDLLNFPMKRSFMKGGKFSFLTLVLIAIPEVGKSLGASAISCNGFMSSYVTVQRSAVELCIV